MASWDLADIDLNGDVQHDAQVIADYARELNHRMRHLCAQIDSIRKEIKRLEAAE